MAAGNEARKLDQTPTWAVAVVCAVIVLLSVLLEKGLHHLGQWFTKKNKKSRFEALEKVKAELMILGFISLLLTFGQDFIELICISESAGNSMLPCPITDLNSNSTLQIDGSAISKCPLGKVPLISVNGVHQLHLFIFFLALIHVMCSATTMIISRAKIRLWKNWEMESTDYELYTDQMKFRFTVDTTFVSQYSSSWSKSRFFIYIVSFFRQFYKSVSKTDYLTVRHGFINVHLSSGNKFDFQKYIMRSLEDDFKVVVGISPILWASAIIMILLNIHGFRQTYWISLIPLTVILSVGTKLQAIIAQMALEIQERNLVIQGIPLVRVSDHNFWFDRPRFVLFLIHFTLFQNAFQLTYFFWFSYMFRLRSCFHENLGLIITKICTGIGIHLLCTYITLPLYSLVSQMGSQIKMSIFDEQTSRALKKWHSTARKKQREGKTYQMLNNITSVNQSLISTPSVHQLHRHKTIAHVGGGKVESEITDTEIEFQLERAHSAQPEFRLEVYEESPNEKDDLSSKLFSNSTQNKQE